MNRERRKEEVVDPVARGLVSDLARHMSCLQEQLDQVKRQLMQLTLNTAKTTKVESKSKGCSENAMKKGNSKMANPMPLFTGDVEKGNEESLQGSRVETGNDASISPPSAEGMPGVMNNKSTRASLLSTDAEPKAKLHQKYPRTTNKMKISESDETNCALQGVVSIRPRIIKRLQR